MLSYDVPMCVIVLITLLTDLYTFVHINYYKHCSTYQEENNFLKDKCKVCNAHCNDQCIVGLKVDIPLKSTSTSCILLAFDFMILFSLQFYHSIVILPLHNSTIKVDNLELLDIIASFFFNALNIPMIVSLSKKNNFANLSSERQRINTLAWNRTHNQRWEIKCALENRIQHQQA